jgi:adenosylcobyric acid synthase
MHMGRTTGAWIGASLAAVWRTAPARCIPKARSAADGRVMGGYLHGIFGADEFRAHWLEQVGAQAARLDFEARIEAALDELADHIERCLDLDALLELAC